MRYGLQILLTLPAYMLCCCTALFAEASSVEYRAQLKGAPDRAVRNELEASLLTFRLEDRPPATLGRLRRRVEGDVARAEIILESRGYYDAAMETGIDAVSDPARVSFIIEPGERYRFGSVELHFEGAPDAELQPLRSELRSGSKAVAARVFEEEQRIIRLLQRRGYPFPTLERRRVTIDRTAHRVDVRLEFDVGLSAVFGGFEVEGLESLNRKYIRRQLPWRPGDPYDARRLDDVEKRLLRSGLFAAARVEPLPTGEKTNAVQVGITVRERDLRTIRLGVNYSDIGFGGRVQWEHRNLLGSGEHLETSFTGSEIELGGRVALTRPGFLRANQSLVVEFDASYETPDAYDARKMRTSAMVLRDFTPEVQAGAGAGYQNSLVEQLASTERYGLVIFPLQGVLDYRDDRLNPVRGVHLLGRTAYCFDTLGSDSFQKSTAEGRHYLMLLERYRLSTALRVLAGSIDGASIERVPADERFYAGGGGSVRGYEYQAIGPSVNGTPVGGDRLLEFSAELRLQPGRRIGYAAFVDGGAVYNDYLSGDDHSMRFGAGLGLRWFTGIGPLRADAAFPLNPAATQVERVQFYISLGQAF